MQPVKKPKKGGAAYLRLFEIKLLDEFFTQSVYLTRFGRRVNFGQFIIVELKAFMLYFIEFGCHGQPMYYNRAVGFCRSQNKIPEVQAIPRQF